MIKDKCRFLIMGKSCIMQEKNNIKSLQSVQRNSK